MFDDVEEGPELLGLSLGSMSSFKSVASMVQELISIMLVLELGDER